MCFDCLVTTQAHIELNEIHEAIKAGRLKPDGKVPHPLTHTTDTTDQQTGPWDSPPSPSLLLGLLGVVVVIVCGCAGLVAPSSLVCHVVLGAGAGA